MGDKTDSYERRLEEERLILDATELLHRLMEREGVKRVDLARRIGKTRGLVSQLLDGHRNMTLRTLAGLAYALDHRVTLEAKARSWWELAQPQVIFLSGGPRETHRVITTGYRGMTMVPAGDSQVARDHRARPDDGLVHAA